MSCSCCQRYGPDPTRSGTDVTRWVSDMLAKIKSEEELPRTELENPEHAVLNLLEYKDKKSLGKEDVTHYYRPVPFDTDDPEFARGYEVSSIYHFMCDWEEEFAAIITEGNVEMVNRFCTVMRRGLTVYECAGRPGCVLVHVGAMSSF